MGGTGNTPPDAQSDPPVEKAPGQNVLRQVVDHLLEDPSEATRARAGAVARRSLRDDNPRDRAQARGILRVLRLFEDGDLEAARDLLENELYRSFQGRGDVDPSLDAAERAQTRGRQR